MTDVVARAKFREAGLSVKQIRELIEAFDRNLENPKQNKKEA